MKLCVFIISIVIQATICEKAISKLQSKWIAPKMNDECKKIKCTNVEDPQCLQMRRNNLTLTVHVIAANKCELEYVQCHDDVEAKIVPMKYCSHNATLTAGKKITETGKAHIRVKRKTDKLRDASKSSETKLSESKEHRMNNGKLPLLWKSKHGHSITKLLKGNKLKENNDSNVQAGQSYEHTISTKSETDDETNETTRSSKGSQANTELPSISSLNMKLPESEESTDFPMISQESANSSAMADADMAEYDEDCPTVCPARDVMVCGRCQHGIYKTFNSVCHMRMFSCKHNDEKMELISREPCAFSAPYLSGRKMMPIGRITEHNDDDNIMRFIRSRDKHVLNKQTDPRRNVTEAKKSKLFLDVFKCLGLCIGRK